MRALRMLTCFVAAACLFATTGFGCSPPTGKVLGTVRFKGELLHSGTVKFVGADGKEVYGPISPDGEYQVSGLAVGEARISVVSRPAVPEGLRRFPNPASPFSGAPGPAPDKVVEIPLKYNDTQTSGLTYVVTSGEQHHAIDLPP